MQEEKLYSPKQSADYLNCTLSKVRKDIYLKRLTYVKVGRLVRIRKSVLDQFLEANTHAAL